MLNRDESKSAFRPFKSASNTAQTEMPPAIVVHVPVGIMPPPMVVHPSLGVMTLMSLSPIPIMSAPDKLGVVFGPLLSAKEFHAGLRQQKTGKRTRVSMLSEDELTSSDDSDQLPSPDEERPNKKRRTESTSPELSLVPSPISFTSSSSSPCSSPTTEETKELKSEEEKTANDILRALNIQNEKGKINKIECFKAFKQIVQSRPKEEIKGALDFLSKECVVRVDGQPVYIHSRRPNSSTTLDIFERLDNYCSRVHIAPPTSFSSVLAKLSQATDEFDNGRKANTACLQFFKANAAVIPAQQFETRTKNNNTGSLPFVKVSDSEAVRLQMNARLISATKNAFFKSPEDEERSRALMDEEKKWARSVAVVVKPKKKKRR